MRAICGPLHKHENTPLFLPFCYVVRIATVEGERRPLFSTLMMILTCKIIIDVHDLGTYIALQSAIIEIAHMNVVISKMGHNCLRFFQHAFNKIPFPGNSISQRYLKGLGFL